MSTTAVPIPPTAGSTKLALWGGVAALILAGGALAWQGTAQFSSAVCGKDAFLPSGDGVGRIETLGSGTHFQAIRAGKGRMPGNDDVAIMSIKVTQDGKTIINEPAAPFVVSNPQAEELGEAVKKMQVGGSYRLCVPGRKPPAGQKPPAGAPDPAAPTRVEAELLSIETMAQFQQQQMEAQLREQLSGQGGHGQATPPTGAR